MEGDKEARNSSKLLERDHNHREPIQENANAENVRNGLNPVEREKIVQGVKEVIEFGQEECN